MLDSTIRWRTLVAALCIVPAIASAQIAVTTQGVNMRAGPDRSFPQVAWLPGGARVEMYGCVEGWAWCDVRAGPNRGWVYSKFLSYPYQNRPVVIYDRGPALGLPLITFSIGNYWDSYYRGRPWWNNRSYWYDRYDRYDAPRRYGPPGRYDPPRRYDPQPRQIPPPQANRQRTGPPTDEQRARWGGPDPPPRPNDIYNPNQQQ